MGRSVQLRSARTGVVRVGLIILSSGAMAALGGGVALASGSSTPSSPSAPTPAAGFQTTVLSQVVAPSSSTQTVTATADGANVSVVVPAGAFGNTTVNLVVTEPTLSDLTSTLSALGLGGSTLATGVGVEVVDAATGQPLTGTFAQPLTVTITSSGITSGSKVIEFPTSGSPFVDSAAEVVSGKAVVQVSSDPGFAVATPTSASVPAATSPVTGKDFLPVGIAGGVLVIGGAALIVASERRRHA